MRVDSFLLLCLLLLGVTLIFAQSEEAIDENKGEHEEGEEENHLSSTTKPPRRVTKYVTDDNVYSFHQHISE